MYAPTMTGNALSAFSKPPFYQFRGGEFSPVGNAVEEILGRLGCLRRNQRIVDVTDDANIPNSFQLLRDHEMYVLNISNSPNDLDDFKNYTCANNGDIDDVLSRHNFPEEFPLLSLHSNEKNEHAMWNSVRKYRPLVVVVPIDPTIDPSKDGERGFKSMNALAETKGYRPVAHEKNLVVYVRDDLLTHIGVKSVVLKSPAMLFDRNSAQ